MTTLKPTGSDFEGEVKCENCDAIFVVVFSYGHETMDGVQYCPFCGEEVEDGE